MATTRIDWADSVWNPVTGCTKVSPGCKNCYAQKMAHRLKAMGQRKYIAGFEVMTHHDALTEPLGWKKPQRVFVCSMGDLFHEDVPFEFIAEVFAVAASTPRHTYLVLTKRPERMLEYAKILSWPANVWAGTSVENNDYVHRADLLRQIPAPVRFISAEPLLGPLPDLDLTGIDQLIVGGESGPGWRPMEVEWARELRDRCIDENVSFFFKQYAELHPKALGRELNGRIWDQMPEQLPGRRGAK